MGEEIHTPDVTAYNARRDGNGERLIEARRGKRRERQVTGDGEREEGREETHHSFLASDSRK
jgi:hypothetical protein